MDDFLFLVFDIKEIKKDDFCPSFTHFVCQLSGLSLFITGSLK